MGWDTCGLWRRSSAWGDTEGVATYPNITLAFADFLRQVSRVRTR